MLFYIDCSFKDAETLMFVWNRQGHFFFFVLGQGIFPYLIYRVPPPCLKKIKRKIILLCIRF